jgi:Tfp pilus assembly protein FimT
VSRRNSQAFTLIELMVVISIIILALAMAVPAMSRFTRGRGLENAGRLMQSAISEARRSAITAFKPHYLIMFRTERGPSGPPTIWPTGLPPRPSRR